MFIVLKIHRESPLERDLYLAITLLWSILTVGSAKAESLNAMSVVSSKDTGIIITIEFS